MSKSPVRIAVAGVGFMGRRHLGFLLSHAEFEAVGAADPTPEAAQWLSARGVPHYADYVEMLDKAKPEAVVITTPNPMHEAVALACMERGITPLVEKPIAHTLESGKRIVEASASSGVPVLVGHHRRHNPFMRAARDFIGTGALGQIVTIVAKDLRRKPDAYYNAAWKREPGGGPILLNAIHDIDCIRYLCGEIETVVAVTSNKARGYAVEESVAATFTLDTGAIGNLTLSDTVQAPWAWELTSGEEPEYARGHEDCYLICGTEGSLAVPTLTHWRNEVQGGRADPFILKRLFYVPADPWVEELRHLGQVARREADPIITAQDGLLTLAATLAIQESAQRGSVVRVQELLGQAA